MHGETGAHTSLKPISIEITDISTHSSQRDENVGDNQLSELSIQLTYLRNALHKPADMCERLCRNANEERLDYNMFHEYQAKQRSEPNAQSIKHTTTAPTSVAQSEEKELRHTKGKRSQAQHRSSVNLHGGRRARRCATLCTLQKKTDATLLETLHLGFLASDIQGYLRYAQKKVTAPNTCRYNLQREDVNASDRNGWCDSVSPQLLRCATKGSLDCVHHLYGHRSILLLVHHFFF